MNTVQADRFTELAAAVTTLRQSFAAGNQDAFDDNCNLILGTLQELRRDLVEQLESTPTATTLADLMEAGRLPTLVGGESPSD